MIVTEVSVELYLIGVPGAEGKSAAIAVIQAF
jgi:hypothetical protein